MVHHVTKFEGEDGLYPDYELHRYYEAQWPKVSEELDVMPTPDSPAESHSEAIDFAQRCVPSPQRVLYIEEEHGVFGVKLRSKREIFTFAYQPLEQPHTQFPPLDEALDNFMAVAFKNCQDQCNWRGPAGINKAIRDLKAAYFTEKPEKLDDLAKGISGGSGPSKTGG